MGRVLIQEDDICIGQPTPWDAYSGSGLLLLRAGHVVSSEEQRDRLLARGLYREGEEVDPVQDDQNSSPFQRVRTIAAELLVLLRDIADGNDTQAVSQCDLLASRLEELVDQNADVALGAVQLDNESPYTQLHPLLTGIITHICARRLGCSDLQRHRAVMATLVSNVGMLDLQDELAGRPGGLSDEERRAVEDHPRRGVLLLREAGFEDKRLLRIVAQHHERDDGKGYPRALVGEQICQGAKIIALADIYAAMVLPRRYRRPLNSHEAIKRIFMERGALVDVALAEIFISELGLYPPGTFVRLKTGETGVVIRRSARKASEPAVSCLSSPDGREYGNPVIRNTAERQSLQISEVIDRPDTLGFDLPALWGFTLT